MFFARALDGEQYGLVSASLLGLGTVTEFSEDDGVTQGALGFIVVTVDAHRILGKDPQASEVFQEAFADSDSIFVRCSFSHAQIQDALFLDGFELSVKRRQVNDACSILPLQSKEPVGKFEQLLTDKATGFFAFTHGHKLSSKVGPAKLPVFLFPPRVPAVAVRTQKLVLLGFGIA